MLLQGDNMQKFISIEPMEPGTMHESTGLLQSNRTSITTTEIFDVSPINSAGDPPNNSRSSNTNLTRSHSSSFIASGNVNPMFDRSYEKDATSFSPLNNIVANPTFTTDSLVSPFSGQEGGSFVNSTSTVQQQHQQVLNNARARELKATKEPKSVRK
jgi:hypothetical protein